MSDIYIRLERPEDYDDVDRQLVIEDFTDNFRDNPQAWVYHDATDEIERLRAVVDAARTLVNGSNVYKELVILERAVRALDGEPCRNCEGRAWMPSGERCFVCEGTGLQPPMQRALDSEP